MGSCIGRACLGPENIGNLTGVGTTRGAGLTCWPCLCKRTVVGCVMPALGAVLVMMEARGYDCTRGEEVTSDRANTIFKHLQNIEFESPNLYLK